MIQFLARLFQDKRCGICQRKLKRNRAFDICFSCSPENPFRTTRCELCFSKVDFCAACSTYPLKVKKFIWLFSYLEVIHLIRLAKFDNNRAAQKTLQAWIQKALEHLDFEAILLAPINSVSFEQRGVNHLFSFIPPAFLNKTLDLFTKTTKPIPKIGLRTNPGVKKVLLFDDVITSGFTILGMLKLLRPDQEISILTISMSYPSLITNKLFRRRLNRNLFLRKP
jgi:predicted amidophosphoribosyltransferase